MSVFLRILVGQAKLFQGRRQVVDIDPAIAVPVELLEDPLQPLLVGLGQLVQIVHRRICLAVVRVAVSTSAVPSQVQIDHRTVYGDGMESTTHLVPNPVPQRIHTFTTRTPTHRSWCRKPNFWPSFRTVPLFDAEFLALLEAKHTVLFSQ